jgi:hypothetical protein
MTQPERRDNYLRCRREASMSALMWVLAFVWTLSVSWWLGQERPAPLWFGIPRWVLLGVTLPWLACFAFNCWFTLIYLRERPR